MSTVRVINSGSSHCVSTVRVINSGSSHCVSTVRVIHSGSSHCVSTVRVIHSSSSHTVCLLTGADGSTTETQLTPAQYRRSLLSVTVLCLMSHDFLQNSGECGRSQCCKTGLDLQNTAVSVHTIGLLIDKCKKTAVYIQVNGE